MAEVTKIEVIDKYIPFPLFWIFRMREIEPPISPRTRTVEGEPIMNPHGQRRGQMTCSTAVKHMFSGCRNLIDF